ncbi:hypothetical protein, partial [Neolewinella agarilytica]|uniref:hypothetical protein n=1 Tax=Neolewinella agarilytica TaxID=478744 RepID=UPI002357018E
MRDRRASRRGVCDCPHKLHLSGRFCINYRYIYTTVYRTTDYQTTDYQTTVYHTTVYQTTVYHTTVYPMVHPYRQRNMAAL